MVTMPQDLKSRFMAKVRVNDVTDCWEWTASKQRGGYGQIMVGARPNNKPLRAHRVSYELFCGEIPDGLHVLHRCDNRACVNPSHLFLGTNADNQADMDAKGRRVNSPLKGEANGAAKLTAGEAMAIRSARGISHRELAAKFGISRSQVQNILYGRLWKCLDEASC
jgi:hypothetical protein